MNRRAGLVLALLGILLLLPCLWFILWSRQQFTFGLSVGEAALFRALATMGCVCLCLGYYALARRPQGGRGLRPGVFGVLLLYLPIMALIQAPRPDNLADLLPAWLWGVLAVAGIGLIVVDVARARRRERVEMPRN